MKGKVEIIGIIPKEKIFAAQKPRASVSFRCGFHKAEKPPRIKLKPRDYEKELLEEDEVDS